MAELTPHKLPRSQMGMDLLRAISEPRMTPQDLAMQQEQERVKKFGGISMPTQDQNILEGLRKVTGLDVKSLEQTPLDRAAIAADWIAPGIKGKAMMPAFKESMGVGVMPLVTKFQQLFRGGRSAEAEKNLLDITKSARERFPRDFNPDIPPPPPGKGVKDVHALGIHGSPESWMANFFMDWGKDPVGGVVSQFRMGGGRSVRVPAPKDPGGWGGVVNDYEQVGRYIANSLFENDYVFKKWMQRNAPKRLSRNIDVDSVWKRLSPSTSKKDRGGYLSNSIHDPPGTLLPKNHLSKELAKIDKEIVAARKVPHYASPEGRSKALQKLKLKRDSTKEIWKRRYVEDFGAYVFKSRLARPNGQNLVDTDSLVRRFRANMKKKNISSLRYRNTSPTETGHRQGVGMDAPPGMPRLTGKSGEAVMVLDIDKMKPSYGGRVTSNIPALAE